MFPRHPTPLAAFLLLAVPAVARAGMASPLPLETELAQRLNDSVLFRVQAISFFVAVLLLCALVVRGLWNYLRRDLTFLPRLTFGKALAGVILWALLAFIVLTMIAGARELLTPGAWRKDGYTYRLDVPVATDEDSSADRQRQLERLRTALWQFAATHNGRFPSQSELSEVPEQLWLVPGGAGLRYHYVPGLRAGKAGDLLVYEPELERDRRLVILTSGEIAVRSSAEILSQIQTGGKP